jgi:alkylhydroperoxidase/carboxymuconolactone decarboxylase family protein YurZ
MSMTKSGDRDAWVAMPSGTEVRRTMPPGHPYDFGFFPAMGRLVAAHPTIAGPFGALFAEIMFAPGALARSERETIAAVAAAAQDCHY